MPEIVVLSGKGGTGKTTVTAALAHLAGPEKIICDLDVDAPDLHLILNPEVEATEDFISGHQAVIDPDRCVGCGLCAEKCLFDAVEQTDEGYEIKPLKCEGCKVCVTLCPEQAIDFPDNNCGQWYQSVTRWGPMVHAQLYPGEENSGRLVSLLRGKAAEQVKENGWDLIISDGPPGIGCPVISSLSRVDFALLVTEPTVSGRHDLERIVDLAAHFKVPVGVVINKWDLNPAAAEDLEEFCKRRDLPMLTKIPFAPAVVEAVMAGRAVTEGPDSEPARALRELWPRLRREIYPGQSAKLNKE